jgi:hypothetical protein
VGQTTRLKRQSVNSALSDAASALPVPIHWMPTPLPGAIDLIVFNDLILILEIEY